MIESILLVAWFAGEWFAARQHIPWSDEVQAWMLSGEVSWKQLFFHSLHYEGSGGLWHALLKLLILGGFSFNAARIGLIACQGLAVVLILGRSPFPALLRFLLPFTFFFFYQDTVVARSYGLFALLAFTVCVLLRMPRCRPIALGLLLGVTSAISVHAAIFALSAALVAFYRWRAERRQSILFLLFFIPLWSFSFLVASPAKDIDASAGNNLARTIAIAERSLGVHVTLPSSLPTQWTAGLPPKALASQQHLSKGTRLWIKVSRALAVITYPLARYRSLAFVLCGSVFLQAFAVNRKRSSSPSVDLCDDSVGPVGLLVYVIPVLFFSGFYLSPQHAGMITTAFIACAWLTWPSIDDAGQRRSWLSDAALASFVAVSGLQIVWTAEAVKAESLRPYAPGSMTAEYLKSRGVVSTSSRDRVAGYYYFSIDPLFYFTRNIYFNQPPHRYWSWSLEMRTYSTVQQVLAAHPQFIVVGGIERGEDAEITRDWHPNAPSLPGVRLGDSYDITDFFEAHQYAITHVFCGYRPMRSTYSEMICETVLEPM